LENLGEIGHFDAGNERCLARKETRHIVFSLVAKASRFGLSAVNHVERRIPIGGCIMSYKQKSLNEQVERLQEQVNRLEVARLESQEREEFYRRILQQAQEGIIVLDSTLRYRYWNQAMETMTGQTAAEVLGKHVLEVLSQARDNGVYDLNTLALAGQVSSTHDLRVVHRVTGEVKWHSSQRVPLRDEEGVVLGVIVTVRDVTAQKEAEEQVAESERRFRSAIQAMQEGFVLHNRAGEIVVCNQSAERILGLTADQMMGLTSLDPRWRSIHPDGSDFPGETHPAVVSRRQGIPQSGVLMGIYKSTGELTWVSVNSVPLWQENEVSGVVVTFADITDLKTMLSQLEQASKLESLGRLAGGIAHDFSNILTAIVGYTDLARREVAPDTDLAFYLENVLTSAEQASLFSKQLLTYARRQQVEFHSINLNEVILQMESLLRHLIGETYELVFVLAEAVWNVQTNASQMEQVLMNLIINARDAMPDGGRITVETANVNLDPTSAADPFGVVPGEYVTLIVSDHGIGMTKDMQAHIFEPFFTTKDSGKGTGLGLSICYGIVQQSQGSIRVDSELGQGTTFTVYLPRRQDLS
jgi:two-component system, cell cycle sensor histidine kinase and response regulator CckA